MVQFAVSKRMPSGKIVEFSAKEYWVENYATAGRDTTAPNAMWKSALMASWRSVPRLQALRKAWPEVASSPACRREMEGKTLKLMRVT